MLQPVAAPGRRRHHYTVEFRPRNSTAASHIPDDEVRSLQTPPLWFSCLAVLLVLSSGCAPFRQFLGASLVSFETEVALGEQLAAQIEQECGVEPRLIKGDNGIFDVKRDGQLIYSKHQTDRFPEAEEVLEQLR